MLKTYLNTIDAEFYDADGNLWRDGYPQLIVGGHEEINIILCTDTANAASDLAAPEEWERDTSFAAIDGISAILTIDSDNIHYIKGTLSSAVETGAMTISAAISQSDYSTIPDAGSLRLFDQSGNAENIAYQSRSIAGNIVTFNLATAIQKTYAAQSVMDVQQSPICQVYLDADKSNLANGELVFNLVCDSDRLRALTDYSNSSSISIRGIELLFYTIDENSYIRKLRAYLWDTPSLSNSMGEPGFSAPVPDPMQDSIAGIVKTVTYSKTEIDNMIGNAEQRLMEL